MPMHTRRLVMFTLMVIVLLTGACSGDSDYAGVRIYVYGSATGGNTGASWEDAFMDLQDALDAARAGDEIWVGQGTYRPSERTDPDDPRSSTFTMVEGVAIYGGFAADETERYERDWEGNATILCGDIGVADESSDNSYHVVLGADGATLDGFTVTNGNADVWTDDDDGVYGGGMLNDASSPVIANCIFIENSAGYGGGMHNRNYSNPSITNCTFVQNTASEHGGGIYNYFGSPSISDCVFSSNHAEGAGGGLYNRNDSSPVVTSCRFIKNTTSAAGAGGGMYNLHDSSPDVANCVFVSNAAKHGGGIYNYNGSSPSVVNCTLIDNHASDIDGASGSGGGIYNSLSSDSVITNCIIWGNAAAEFGDSIYNINSTAVVSYSCVEDSGGSASWDANVGEDSGQNIDTDPLFINAPLLVDITTGDGTTTSVSIDDALSRYSIDDVIDIARDRVARSVTGVVGNAVIFIGDPLDVASVAGTFVRNWGPGATDLLIDPRLDASSPCVGAGDNDAVPASVTEDLDGNPRIVGDGVDMGAYEQQ